MNLADGVALDKGTCGAIGFVLKHCGDSYTAQSAFRLPRRLSVDIAEWDQQLLTHQNRDRS